MLRVYGSNYSNLSVLVRSVCCILDGYIFWVTGYLSVFVVPYIYGRGIGSTRFIWGVLGVLGARLQSPMPAEHLVTSYNCLEVVQQRQNPNAPETPGVLSIGSVLCCLSGLL